MENRQHHASKENNSEKANADSTLKPYTVLGVYESDGLIICDHVMASCEYAAFSKVAQNRGSLDLCLVSALPGHLQEDRDIVFPGSRLVDVDTILEQPDVFPQDVNEQILHAYESLSEFAPDWIAAPGDTITDMLVERGWTEDDLATRTGLNKKHVHLLVQGEIPISEDIALRLERALGGSVQFWMNLESQRREQLFEANSTLGL